MATALETNRHLQQLMQDVPREVAASFGEAFLEIQAQRAGRSKADASQKLRAAWLDLAKVLLKLHPASLNPQQRLFLVSGAVADSVSLKDEQGERLDIELLPAELYGELLAKMTDPASFPAWIMLPQQRLHVLASGQLKPYDPNRSGRYSGQPLSAGGTEPAAGNAADTPSLEDAYRRCQDLQAEVSQRTRRLVSVLASENLGPVMQGLLYPGNELKRVSQDGKALASLAKLASGGNPPQHDSVTRLRRLSEQFSEAAASLERSQLELLENIDGIAALARALDGQPAAKPGAPSAAPATDDKALRLLESDSLSIASFINQTLINDPRRTAWSAARVLTAEQLDKCADPLRECLLTPARLQECLSEMMALHVNCFPLDSEGRPIIPAIFIEPGQGIVKWMDDRFIVSFVQNEQSRQGSELSLCGTQLAALRIMGLFLARGDIFNYRGERIADSFMAEYAGQIEQKATVKFTGASKKMSYGTSTEEKDGASREDAVNDYIDFIFAIHNRLPLPKKISTRKIGVLLKYCIFRDVRFTACLVMRLVAPADQVLAREIILSLAQQSGEHSVDLIRHTLEADQQVAARYRNDSAHAVKEILGKLAQELTREADSGVKAGGSVRPEGAAETVHDYFDV